jgi:hypothetical protein
MMRGQRGRDRMVSFIMQSVPKRSDIITYKQTNKRSDIITNKQTIKQTLRYYYKQTNKRSDSITTINKPDRHDIPEILLKVALNNIIPPLSIMGYPTLADISNHHYLG